MRGFLEKLPAFASRELEGRFAFEYSPRDLIVLAVCYRLEAEFRIERKAIGEAYDKIATALSGPKPVSGHAKLLIRFSPLDVVYLEDMAQVQSGIVFALQPIFDLVDGYLGRATIFEHVSQDREEKSATIGRAGG